MQNGQIRFYNNKLPYVNKKKKKTITNKCYGFCIEPAEGLEPTTC